MSNAPSVHTHSTSVRSVRLTRRDLATSVVKYHYSFYRGFVLLPSKIVLLDLLLGGTLGLRRWPTPLGPPTDLMPGHLSPECGLTTLNDTHLRDGQSR